MSVYIGDVQTFAGVIADKPQVLKIGEETMEVFSAWEDYKYAPEFRKEALIAEIADVIQAACNLLAAIGVDDMRQPMQECYVRNKERGREYESTTNQLASKSDVAKSAETDENATTKGEIRDFDDSREKLEADIGLFVARYMPKEDSPKMFKAICSFLDRQAAITAIEVARERYDFERGLIAARDELQEALNAAAGKWAKADAHCSELQAKVDSLTAERDTWRERFDKANREKCDLQSRDTNQRHNNLLNRLREKGVVVSWDDSRSDYMVLLNNCDAARELQEQNENQRAIIKDLQQERVTVEQLNIGLVNKSKELREENDGLKARIESLRAKLSKMLDAASEIQHIGDLP